MAYEQILLFGVIVILLFLLLVVTGCWLFKVYFREKQKYLEKLDKQFNYAVKDKENTHGKES